LIELIVTATNEEKIWYRGNNHLKQNLCGKVEKAAEVSGKYKDLLLALCNKDRETGFDHTDEIETDRVRNNI
jgi:hypothetical protein